MGQNKLELTTLDCVVIHVVCQFNSNALRWTLSLLKTSFCLRRQKASSDLPQVRSLGNNMVSKPIPWSGVAPLL